MDATRVSSLTLRQLRELYLRHAETHYRRRTGDPSGEHRNLQTSINSFVGFAGEFVLGDRINHHLVRAWVDQQAAGGVRTRKYVNKQLDHVRRWVRWCCDLDHIPFAVTKDLRRVKRLREFRSTARESSPVDPPTLDQVLVVAPFLPPLARDVLRLIKLTAARPSELLEAINREVIIDELGARLVPRQHKCAHHGIARVIPLSPEALAILDTWRQPMLPDAAIFTSKRRNAKGGHYSLRGFRGTLSRACRRAGVKPFKPYDVRHAVARHVRKLRGLDSAQALLGHVNARTTEIYAPLPPGNPQTLDAARRGQEVL